MDMYWIRYCLQLTFVNFKDSMREQYNNPHFSFKNKRFLGNPRLKRNESLQRYWEKTVLVGHIKENKKRRREKTNNKVKSEKKISRFT